MKANSPAKIDSKVSNNEKGPNELIEDEDPGEKLEDGEEEEGDEDGEEGQDSERHEGFENEQKGHHKIAGLNCDAYGGPEDPSEMIYWEDIPSDALHVSPLQASGPGLKYLIFEPDQGGWNNIRMSMETAVTMAHAMGRTLVMPPQQGMYLLNEGKNEQKRHFTFSDFFHFDSVATEHAGVDVISMEEFLQREVMTGNMKDKASGGTTFPPMNNRTNWDNAPEKELRQLNEWFTTFALTPHWKTDECVVGLPSRPGPEGPARLWQIGKQLYNRTFQHRRAQYVGKPVAVDADPVDRLDEILVDRRKVCVYDEQHQNAQVIHMMGDGDLRLLIHFYAFLFFEDWKHDLWTKRFVRDHIRYADEIQCPAARVVKAMRQKAIENGNREGVFDTIHIRRGDFQYKDTRLEGDQIYENMKELIPAGTTVFIATDERKKVFFDVFHKHYKVYFLNDFMHELKGVNTNFYGMIDQRVASRGRNFVGCFYSTFTGYINRMRGYHAQKEKADGWERGVVNSWYYVPLEFKDVLRDYWPLSPPLWAREFPIAWRDLDRGITELANEQQAFA